MPKKKISPEQVIKNYNKEYKRRSKCRHCHHFPTLPSIYCQIGCKEVRRATHTCDRFTGLLPDAGPLHKALNTLLKGTKYKLKEKINDKTK